MLRNVIHGVIFSIGSLFLIHTSSAIADYSKRVCGGEGDKDKCPVTVDIMIGCNPTDVDAVAAACTVISNGQRKVLNGHADPQGTHEGGRCGYRWYQVTCFTE